MSTNWKVEVTRHADTDEAELETITSEFVDEAAATGAALAWDIFAEVDTVRLFNPDGEEVELS